MSDKQNITFITDSLKTGGAERVISIMANYWARQGKNVSILTLKQKAPFYAIDSEINYIELGITKKSGFFFDGIVNGILQVRTIEKKLKDLKTEVVISFFADINVISIMAARKADIPIIISERNNPSFVNLSYKWIIARRLFYRFADFLVVQTKEVKSFYRKFGIDVISIPNPVSEYKTDTTKKNKTILAVGKLEEQKGFDLLMEAFKKANLPPEWKLKIVGDGSLKNYLIQYKDKLGLDEKVYFAGKVKNIMEVYNNSSVFVLSSIYEGFPNVLIEAMSAGLPVISFNCKFGPEEIIEHNENGILVQARDTTKLAKEIRDLVNNEKKRNRLGKNAGKVKEKYSCQTIMEKWERVIDSIS